MQTPAASRCQGTALFLGGERVVTEAWVAWGKHSGWQVLEMGFRNKSVK